MTSHQQPVEDFNMEDATAFLDEPLEIDREWETDSALGGMSHASSTSSVSSSIYDVVEENGRTYHRYKEGQYFLPNDEQEQNRLDFQNSIFRMCLGDKLHIAPIAENPKNVLDVATGTGIWAIEFAQENPGSAVIGTDLSPIQPDYAPSNVSFEIMDAEDEWTFQVPFDLIHLRAIISCFKDTKSVFKSALDNLVPGTGYMFVRDPLMPFQFFTPPPDDCAIVEWNRLLVLAGNRVGMPWNRGIKYADWMREVGFVDVVEKRERAAVSQWPKGKRNKYIALLFQEDFCNGIEGMSMALFTRVLGWSKERLVEFLEKVREDIRNVDLHVFSEGVIVYGRRPYPEQLAQTSHTKPEIAAI